MYISLSKSLHLPSLYPVNASIISKNINREEIFLIFLLLLPFISKTLKRKKEEEEVFFLKIMHHSKANFRKTLFLSHLDKYEIIIHNRFSHTLVLWIARLVTKFFSTDMELEILK